MYFTTRATTTAARSLSWLGSSSTGAASSHPRHRQRHLWSGQKDAVICGESVIGRVFWKWAQSIWNKEHSFRGDPCLIFHVSSYKLNLFFVKGALYRGKGGPTVLDKPAQHLPRQGRGFISPPACPNLYPAILVLKWPQEYIWRLSQLLQCIENESQSNWLMYAVNQLTLWRGFYSLSRCLTCLDTLSRVVEWDLSRQAI